MSTVPNNPHKRTHGIPGTDGRENDMRHDRIIAVLVVVGMLALFGLIIWLASLSSAAPSGDYDFWMGS